MGEILSLSPAKVLSLGDAVRYDLLILQGRFPSARVVVMTPLQSIRISSEMLADVSGIIDEVASAIGAVVIRQDLLCPVDSEREMTRRRLTTDGTHTSEEGARRNSSVIADCVNDIYNPSAAQATDILK